LVNLRELSLSDNNLTELPKEITRMENLQTLDLGRNNLTKLPKSIANLVHLRSLELSVSKFTSPEPPIIKQGIVAIFSFFIELEKGTDVINEAKLILVGEGYSGKTSLAKKLINPHYTLQNDEDQTRGIDVMQWSFAIKDGKEFRVNIWDFGGQEIYKATHQFFLTKRSLYALVADNRQGNTDYYYWLSAINVLSEASPTVLVKNKKNLSAFAFDEPKLKAQFANLKDPQEVDLKDNTGLQTLKEYLQFQIQQLPLVGKPLPKSWVDIRNELEQQTTNYNYISQPEFFKICESYGLTTLQKKHEVSGYLHDLGIILHFKDDPILKNIVVLKPEWGTTAVYRVLDNPEVNNNLGHFDKDDLALIWHEQDYEGMHDELLQLMMKFELCYELPHQPKHYIAPQLLSNNRPSYIWSSENNLQLRYKYNDFMPRGMLTRFIVGMHDYIDNNLVWLTGVILSKDGNRAQIIEHSEINEIHINVIGDFRRDFLTEIMAKFDELHKGFQRLKLDRLIPCNCKTCQESNNPSFYTLDEIKKRISREKETIECGESYEDVSVAGLLGDVIDLQQLRRNRNAHGLLSSERPDLLGLGNKDILDILSNLVNKLNSDGGGTTIKVEDNSTHINGNASGVIGPKNTVKGSTFVQANAADLSKLAPLSQLLPELITLKKELAANASTSEHFTALAQIAEAEVEAKKGDKGDKSKVLSILKTVGSWGVNAATRIGTGVAVAYIKASMGQP